MQHILKRTLFCASTGFILSTPYYVYKESKRSGYNTKLEKYKQGLAETLKNPNDPLGFAWLGFIGGLIYNVASRNDPIKIKRINLIEKIGLVNYCGRIKGIMICGSIVSLVAMSNWVNRRTCNHYTGGFVGTCWNCGAKNVYGI